MAHVKRFITDFFGMVRSLALSRKFWIFAAAAVTVGQQMAAGEITNWQALQLLIGAAAAYMGTVAYEDAHRAPAE
jgi:hypothetical protein